jgi:hypothetical protein
MRLDTLSRPAIVLCHGQGNAAAARDVNVALQARNLGGGAFDVLHIIDLSMIPGMLRGMAHGELDKAYRAAAAYLDDPGEAPDRVFLLPDWEGQAAPALGLGSITRAMGVAAVDAGGHLLGTRQGNDPTGAAFELLELLGA